MKSARKMPDIGELALFDGCVTLGRLYVGGVTESLTA